MPALGKVKWYNETKGYGFITSDKGVDIFMHHANISKENTTRIMDGDIVEFDVVEGRKGPEATNVVKIS